MTKISYIEVTARSDYPTQGKPEMHLWEPTLQTLKNQTMKDFEYIVVDIFYDERKDYFKDHNYGLKIKHIPAAPNIWHEKNLVQICHQFNKGIIHADGELLFFNADSNMIPPYLMDNLWTHYKNGWFVSMGFGADVSYGPKYLQDIARTNIMDTEWYRFLDFHGHVTMDHRYNSLFENKNTNFVQIPANWYYGISTVSLKAALDINGFDQAFDPDGTLNDIDFGNRLVSKGYNKFAMVRDCYVIEAFAGADWHKNMKRPEVKCNWGMLEYNRLTGRRANSGLSDTEINYIINDICKKKCPVYKTCQTIPHRGPFFNKNEMETFNYWKDHGANEVVDLGIERSMRMSGDDYKEGTFVN